MLLGMRIKGKVKESYLDIGRAPSVKSSRIYACAKGIQDSGVQLHLSPDVAPPEERIAGKHISEHAAQAAGSGGRQFSQYIKNKADIRGLAQEVERMKAEIQKHGTA